MSQTLNSYLSPLDSPLPRHTRLTSQDARTQRTLTGDDADDSLGLEIKAFAYCNHMSHSLRGSLRVAADGLPAGEPHALARSSRTRAIHYAVYFDRTSHVRFPDSAALSNGINNNNNNCCYKCSTLAAAKHALYASNTRHTRVHMSNHILCIWQQYQASEAGAASIVKRSRNRVRDRLTLLGEMRGECV